MLMRAFGLRPRLLAALMLTSVVTLGVAALALLSPLEARLRSDSVANVVGAVEASRPEFADVPLVNGSPDPTQLRMQTRALERRSGAQVIVFSPDLREVATTADIENPDFEDVRRALVTGRMVQSVSQGELRVAVPVRVGGRRGETFVIALRRRLNYVQSATRVVGNAFLTAAAAGLAIALLLGIGLTTTLLRRLERLRDAAREMERDALQATPPADGRHDEIGELTRAFVAMQAQLRSQETARRTFVATASHELRTPLASLDGMLELLDDDLNAEHLDIEDARERTARAKEQSRRLSRLATDLLDLSRLDAEVTLRSEPVELGEMSRAVVAEFELGARAGGIALALELPSTPCWVAADPGSVARIVRILLDNAVGVAPEDSEIVVEMTCGKRWAALAVQDHGAGVPPGDRELIFERFKRGSNTAGKSGFGLGLAIGRELATRMGGSLELEDGPQAPPDELPGARFVLRLPVVDDPSGNGRT